MDSTEEKIELSKINLKKLMIFIDITQSRILQLTEEIDKLKQTKGVTMSETVETTQAPQQWEYMDPPSSVNATELNKLGAEGWEAFSVGARGSTQTMLKRPKPQKKAPDQGYSGYGR